ncbi:MAG: hypothetical protein GKR90_24410 [Pseudomonadales bacterium]|nr:hypothetical protein [Pseudomonadales bacterium]
MEYLFEVTAMSLDTLPQGGRIMLLAFLLSLAFAGFGRVISPKYGEKMHILYRKAALLALIVVPFLVWLSDIRMAVYVDSYRHYVTTIPQYVTIAVLSAWLVGVIYHVYRLGQRVGLTTAQAPKDKRPGSDKLHKRMRHWCARLNIKNEMDLMVDGGSHPWHTNEVIVLPAAALNWPIGIVDAMLLIQLAQGKNRAWYWVLIGEFIACVFWFAPWVRHMAVQLRRLLPHPAVSLARAAYRDPEGWRRDFRHLKQRLDTLAPVGDASDEYLRLEVGVDVQEPDPPPLDETEPATLEEKWLKTKERRWRKHFDPYERVYWLVAGASLVVAIFTTLTIERTPPEFQPRFLEIKWQDRMAPRIERELQQDRD